MNIIKYIFSSILLCLMVVGLWAQNSRTADKTVVRASLSADSVMIGDQVKLRVEVTKDIVQQTFFPEFNHGTLDSAYIEVLAESAVDTIAREGRVHTISKEYTLTSFDAGQYLIGHFPVMVAGRNMVDTLMSIDSLVLLVTTYQIDTATQTIVDITPPLEAPLKFGEFSQYMLYGVILVAILALVIFYLVRYFRNKNSKTEEVITPEAAHLKAIKALEALNSKKLWQAGHYKHYYTDLTDIVRTYIEERYEIGALEKATDEIITEMKPLTDAKSFKRLSELLSTADYVKFAKHTPDSQDNEDNYNNAYYFVEDTKIIEVEQTDDDTSDDAQEVEANNQPTKQA